MTMTTDRPSGADDEQAQVPPRSELELVRQQLAAIETFNRHLTVAQQAAVSSVRSRELRMGSARRMEVLRRQQQAVIARAHQQLEPTGDLLRATSGRRVVLAHRNEWYLDRASEG